MSCSSNNNKPAVKATQAPTQAARIAATATTAPPVTNSPSPSPTPSPPATPAPAASPSPSPSPTPPPTASPPPSPSPSPTPVPTPQFNPDAIAKSIRDNRGFMPRASVDKLMVDISGNLVTVSVQPTLINETDALTIGAHTALVASKATFSTYSEQLFLQVRVLGEVTDQFGKTTTAELVMLQINRATAEKFDYNGLKDRVTTDNKLLFCVADKYQIRPLVYTKISDRGCLTGPAKS